MARKITVLLGTDMNDCADGRKCPAVIEVEGEEELFVISKPVSDPELLALLGNRLGPGEGLSTVPRTLFFPEVINS
jgi:hypothetical protein